jgi:aerobic-type carbon monoxide dehydrogenase small subunit (CoxS/CutS family)
MKLIVNGSSYDFDGDPDTPLLWVLRDHLDLTGTKYSCGLGICGSCTVLLGGEPIRSCGIRVSAVGDREVATIEGLSGELAERIKDAWLTEEVPQCGYCQPGQILTATALLAENPNPNDEEIDRAMSGVLCRCGSYPDIRRAIRHVADGG